MGMKGRGDDPGGEQFSIAYDTVAGAGRKFTKQKYAIANIFKVVAMFLDETEGTALLIDGEE